MFCCTFYGISEVICDTYKHVYMYLQSLEEEEEEDEEDEEDKEDKEEDVSR